MCQKHGIVRDPLGHCVICDRTDVEVGRDPSGARGAITVLALLGLVVVGALVVRSMGRPEPPVVQSIARAPLLPEPAPAPEPDIAREQARDAQQTREVVDRRERLEKEMRRVPIRVYTTKRCELCPTATSFIKGKGYEITEIDVEKSPEDLAALRALNPESSVPTIVIDEEVIVGFGPSVVMGAIYRAASKKVR